ncbi:MAG TPA: hypothetical protein VFT45_14150 [Longimicrobium sp.]|nr:hypothetical protein [Longimicrobium sp.]
MTDIKPYEPTSPGDLITAELFNRVQVSTREDIAKQVKAAVDAHQYVERARNADALEQKSKAQIVAEIVEQLKGMLPGLTGYKVVYKRLQPDEPAIIDHNLGSYPVVDVCELERFPVVASADGKPWYDRVHWFLYHRTEMKIRRPEDFPDEDPPVPPLITIEESRGPVFRQRFEDVLLQYGVKADGQTALGDVVNEFWKKLFSGLNDPFDETSYANSPWFDRCCGDRRTVESLKRGGEWDDLYLKVVPRKTINSVAPVWPLGVEVVHYDRNRLGLVRADFARLTHHGVRDIFEAEDRKPQAVEGQTKVTLDAARRVAGAQATATALATGVAADDPDESVESIVRRLGKAAADAAAERGHPEPDELFLMVVLKV